MNFNPYNTNATKTVAEFYSWPIHERVITYGIPRNVDGMFGLFNNDPASVAKDIDALIVAFTAPDNDTAMIKQLMTLASVLASAAACADTGYAERDTQHILYAALIAFGPIMYGDIVDTMQLSNEQKDPRHVGRRLAVSLCKNKSVVTISSILASYMRKTMTGRYACDQDDGVKIADVVNYINSLVK